MNDTASTTGLFAGLWQIITAPSSFLASPIGVLVIIVVSVILAWWGNGFLSQRSKWYAAHRIKRIEKQIAQVRVWKDNSSQLIASAVREMLLLLVCLILFLYIVIDSTALANAYFILLVLVGQVPEVFSINTVLIVETILEVLFGIVITFRSIMLRRQLRGVEQFEEYEQRRNEHIIKLKDRHALQT